MPLIIRMFSLLALIGCALTAQARTELSAMPATADGLYKVSLDSCRSMALANNKKMRMAREKVKGSGYVKKEASAAYLPSLDLGRICLQLQKTVHI